MKKIFVASDIHGDYYSFKKFIEKAKENPIFICGDLTPYSQNFSYLLSTIENDIYMVKGNCDNAYDFSLNDINIPPKIRIETFFNRNMLITHGDLFRSPQATSFDLKEGDFFIFGHTHIAKLYIDDNKIINLNPGSLSRPRGYFDSSYAIIQENIITVNSLEDDAILLELSI